MVRWLFLLTFCLASGSCQAWGFYGHKKINSMAIFLLPPSLLTFYKPHIELLAEQGTHPDKRRYAMAEEGPRHYIDMDKYGTYPFDSLPRKWEEAVKKFSQDSLQQHGIVPWWTEIMYYRLVKAFKEKNTRRILKLSAELGHYIADAHVPLHTCSNHNGQFTGQRGIHGFWESRIPELLADKEWDFLLPPAGFISQPLNYIWDRILESHLAVDSVLTFEKKLSNRFDSDKKFAFEFRNGLLLRQYSTAYSLAFHQLLHGMVERRMRQSVHAVASYWYSAWIDAGQPALKGLSLQAPSEEELKDLETLDQAVRNQTILGREE